MQADLRADTKSQLVEKAVGLLVDTGSIAKHYDLLKTRLLSKSGDYITTVVRESPPELGKDGLMSMTTEAVVNVKAVQKSLNQMTRDERVDFIRASGDPKISVADVGARRRSAGRAARSRRRSPRTSSRSASRRSAFAPGPKAARDRTTRARTSRCWARPRSRSSRCSSKHRA